MQNSQRGVTLFELIIVLAILTLVIGTTVSIFISMLKIQSKTVKEQELYSQESYAVEYVASLIQDAKKDASGTCLGASYVGYNYLLNHYSSSTGFYQGIKFLTKDDVCQEIYLDTTGVLKEAENGGVAQDILSDEFTVNYARFIINGDKAIQGSSGSDTHQPRVTFVVSVKLKNVTQQPDRIVQTTVSQRNLNIP